MATILEDIKSALMIGASDSGYDTDLLMHINTASEKLFQNGVTKDIIIDDTTVIDNIVVDKLSPSNLYKSMVTSYLTLQAQLIFNPPQESVVKILSGQCEDYIWRLRTSMEYF